MSFENERDEAHLSAVTPTTPAPPSAGSHNENELPLPPKGGPQTPKTEIDGETRERLDHVLQSDIGVSTLLNRLKQSISSARDFAAFLKERSTIEEKHAQALKKLSRSTHEIIRRPESKGGSFAHNFEEMTKVHDRMSDNGIQYANGLYQMHEELQDLTAKCERDRKHLKQTGLDAEKRVSDAEGAMSKAKGRYVAFAEQLDGVKTGEKTSGKFGRRKDEDELKRKLEGADGEYAQKVQAAQMSRQELLATHRPNNIRALQDAIRECDAGLSMQMQKYATLSERLLLGNGICVSPLKNQTNGASSGPRSLRDIAHNINDQRDYHEYVLGFTNKAGSKPPEIKYVQHHTLAPKQQQPNQGPTSSYDQPQSQSQFGTPERQNTFNPYDRGHRPGDSGQVSGVMPYQPAGPERQASGPPPAQYQSGPPPPNTYQAQPPQLPQIGGFGEQGRRSEQVQSSAGFGDNHQGPSLSQTQSRPDQFSPSSDFGDTRQGTGFGQNQGGTGRFSPEEPSSGFGRSAVGALGAGTLGAGRGGPSGSGFNQDNREASFGAPHSGGRGGPSGPGFNQDNREPSFGAPQSGGRGGPSGSVFDQDHREQSFGGPQNASRGPSFGQPGENISTGRGAPYGQQAYQTQSQQPDARGPPGAPQGPPAANGSFRPPQSTNSFGPGNGPAINLPSQQRRAEAPRQNLPPQRPVFGVSLDELFRRDGSAVPHIVFRCIEAVDIHGVNVEGIYRTSGSAPVIMDLKSQFDHDASLIDFRNPGAYKNDIAAVTTLLKHFLRDLPDPLLTGAAYSQLIQAGQIDDDHMRRDSLHAIINSLPDPNYATLRVLTLHLHRVSQHAERNRMTPHNLAIVFGPTLMGQAGKEAPGDIKDAGWQARVVETIINNTLQIFDDDE